MGHYTHLDARRPSCLTHANADLINKARDNSPTLVIEQGWALRRPLNVSSSRQPPRRNGCVRYRPRGEDGIADVSSRPRRSPNRTPIRPERRIPAKRFNRRWGRTASLTRPTASGPIDTEKSPGQIPDTPTRLPGPGDRPANENHALTCTNSTFAGSREFLHLLQILLLAHNREYVRTGVSREQPLTGHSRALVQHGFHCARPFKAMHKSSLIHVAVADRLTRQSLKHARAPVLPDAGCRVRSGLGCRWYRTEHRGAPTG
ncbi:hypothetical protein E4J89_17510 [Arthrobacter sp. CAU 1506]|nr:hypothetical protein E4J89_17510 [Arthrobacter sp. CAU 1506]